MSVDKIEKLLIRRSESLNTILEELMDVIKQSRTLEILSLFHFTETVVHSVRLSFITNLIGDGYTVDLTNIGKHLQFVQKIEDYLKERYGDQMDGFYRYRIENRTQNI